MSALEMRQCAGPGVPLAPAIFQGAQEQQVGAPESSLDTLSPALLPPCGHPYATPSLLRQGAHHKGQIRDAEIESSLGHSLSINGPWSSKCTTEDDNVSFVSQVGMQLEQSTHIKVKPLGQGLGFHGWVPLFWGRIWETIFLQKGWFTRGCAKQPG